MIRELALRARQVQPAIGVAPAECRTRALTMVADTLAEQADSILEANAADLAAAALLPAPMIARLRLDRAKLNAIIQGVRDVAALPDILGEQLTAWRRPNGLAIAQVRVPLGVIGVIYESRPGVTVDAAALCLKTGNSVLLKGGKEAAHTNARFGEAIAAGLVRAGLPGELVQVLPSTRESAAELMQAAGLVDVLIPRGGAGLIRTVVQESKVPVIETGTGVCHVYVHGRADLAMARAVILNAKCSNPAVCNAAETLLVDRTVAAAFLPAAAEELRAAGVRLFGCPETRELVPWAEPATQADWEAEYLDLSLAVRVVGGLDEALAHIDHYGTRHSEAIITTDQQAADRFLAAVDAATVYHNASTRFTDGGEFGFGAEVGISTQKLHARGPMGLAALTSYKYLVRGDGQVR
ncbi:MAG: glutamate-5-semialdehyde dehydrogenase [Mycobacterium leprae]